MKGAAATSWRALGCYALWGGTAKLLTGLGLRECVWGGDFLMRGGAGGRTFVVIPLPLPGQGVQWIEFHGLRSLDDSLTSPVATSLRPVGAGTCAMWVCAGVRVGA